MQVIVAPDAAAKSEAATAAWMESYLGPLITMRAKAFCPVDTGTLRAGIHQEMDGVDLIVSADEGGQPPRSIAAYLELGHRLFHPFTHEVGPEWVVARPFLRPALYYGFWSGPVGIAIPDQDRPWIMWRPEFGFGGDVRGPSGATAQPRA